jgi:competence CoiA-like predicted nuclease
MFSGRKYELIFLAWWGENCNFWRAFAWRHFRPRQMKTATFYVSSVYKQFIVSLHNKMKTARQKRDKA